MHLVDRLAERAAHIARAPGHLFVTLIVVIAAVIWSVAGAAAWFLYGVVTDLPDKAALQRIGADSQATTLVDRQGR